MFTGIIEAIGKIDNITQVKGDYRVDIHTGKLDMADVKLGDSIAVNGVCLTAVDLSTSGFTADVSNETITHTAFSQLKAGSSVNLERALSLETRLGGHMVSGHVDGIGKIVSMSNDGRSVRYKIEAAANISKYIAKKGSITVDGISLTVNEVTENTFELNIVPHTLQETIMSEYRVDRILNLEVDVIARYVERLLQRSDDKNSNLPASNLNKEFLAQNGFLR